MATIVCKRCQQSKKPMAEAPVGGELGKAVVTHVCPDCWQEWRQTSAQLINHYGLNLGIPDHRAELRRVMKEFLSIQD